jgi:hypothetical protein
MAIDLSNSAYRGNLYTAWLRVNQGLGTQSMVFSRRAKDSTSWSAPIAVNDTTYFGGSSQQQTLVQGAAVAVGVNGEVYMAWTQFGFKVSLPIKATGYLKFDRSTDGGLTFGRDKTVNSHVEVFERYNTASIYQRMHGFPQMAVDRSSGPRRGRIYICYTTMDNGDADVFLVSSDNRGDSWSAPIRVNNDPLRNGVWQFFGQITVSPNGVISIPYYATQGTTSVLDTYVADSWDGGATFLTRKISTHSFTSPSSGFIGDYLGNVAPGDYAFPAWADLTGTNLTDVLGLVDQIPADTGLEPAAPADIRLEGIYPNPLFRRASAEVLFRVNRPASIRLSVADPLGRLVRVLTDETCLPGSHTLSLEGSGLGQGVYFLLLESTGVRQVKKLVVLE